MSEYATVMLEHIPTDRSGSDFQRANNKNDPPVYMYGNKSFPRIPYMTTTPEGFPVEVTIPDPEYAHIRDTSDGKKWANTKSDDLWQCTAHALGTWDPVKRLGYVVDITEGIWTVLNDPVIAEVIMKPSLISTAGILLKAPEVGDVFVIWEDKFSDDHYDAQKKKWGKIDKPVVQADGLRPACHAVRIEEPHYIASRKLQTSDGGGVGIQLRTSDGGGIGILDLVNTKVSSKNGNYALQRGVVLDSIVRVPEYKLRSQAIYRLKGDFKTPLASWGPCSCSHCHKG